MRYRYITVDVFTDRRFGGNQLAVLPDAAGLTGEQMQRITAEFNYSESTFVLPAEGDHTNKVRIFTPAHEMPFAGHPNIGTAFVLAAEGLVGGGDGETTVTFEELAGIVPVTIRFEDGRPVWCELAAPQLLSLGAKATPEAAARALSLSPDDIVMSTHPPQVASVGVEFLLVEVRDRAVLERARSNLDGMDALEAGGIVGAVHLYTRSDDEFDIRARMFAPGHGVAEDPATGSANCTLAGLLAHCDPKPDGSFEWKIAQGVEMGRPSSLAGAADKRGGKVTETRVGGGSVLVMEGTVEVD
jgi:trans-2,3-dihydro-3-hydroxyanthranilate isomerase